MVITFNELRRIKDKLPSGSSQRIADEVGVRRYGTISAVDISTVKAVLRWAFILKKDLTVVL